MRFTLMRGEVAMKKAKNGLVAMVSLRDEDIADIVSRGKIK